MAGSERTASVHRGLLHLFERLRSEAVAENKIVARSFQEIYGDKYRSLIESKRVSVDDLTDHPPIFKGFRFVFLSPGDPPHTLAATWIPKGKTKEIEKIKDSIHQGVEFPHDLRGDYTEWLGEVPRLAMDVVREEGLHTVAALVVSEDSVHANQFLTELRYPKAFNERLALLIRDLLVTKPYIRQIVHQNSQEGANFIDGLLQLNPRIVEAFSASLASYFLQTTPDQNPQ